VLWTLNLSTPLFKHSLDFIIIPSPNLISFNFKSTLKNVNYGFLTITQNSSLANADALLFQNFNEQKLFLVTRSKLLPRWDGSFLLLGSCRLGNLAYPRIQCRDDLYILPTRLAPTWITLCILNAISLPFSISIPQALILYS
jgi:hypothetical protein